MATISAGSVQTFDGVSNPSQKGKKCMIFLQLGDLQVEKKFGRGVKPKNSDLPTAVVTEEKVTVSITLTVDDKRTTYVWEKNHNGRIVKCDVEVEKGQLKVVLTKPDSKDWVGAFVDHLHEL